MSPYLIFPMNTGTNPYKQQLLQQLTASSSLSCTLDNCSDKVLKTCIKLSQYGLPSYDNLRFYSSYMSSVNYERRVPSWVLECIDKECVSKPAQRTSEEDVTRKDSLWQADPFTPGLFRVNPYDYKFAVYEYSRGHMAAAGCHNDEQMSKNETFFMNSNIGICFSTYVYILHTYTYTYTWGARAQDSTYCSIYRPLSWLCVCYLVLLTWCVLYVIPLHQCLRT